ncbi:MAG TPA: dethiobiotin synthase [Verrucomicrobiae bacterium]|jgi:dethiobiotin synthetase
MAMDRIYFITATDTGVGKTVLAGLLVKYLRQQDVSAAALKPVCSGGRDDARHLHSAMDGALSLDEINPWHFRAPIAPLLAARREKKAVRLPAVLARVRAMKKRFDVLVVEGAGGLLSPLGENFDSRDLIAGLRATPILVAPNKLGVVNHVLLTLEALPKNLHRRTKVVLMSPSKPDPSSSTNAKLLAGFFPAKRIFELLWLGERLSSAYNNPVLKTTLRKLLHD